ncbi:uncharacterized protein DUF1990 [Halopolyspora algeriensis]|uniref:Uncharacterized protein DUF1990 n=1 Tax=Halopolyspora algeriensis TaxID=1500506 RepID=A0A368VE90_9ACTN|nr:DUF1990 family protein [Halopolyspora algeriensis]RCW39577.1 uncharacterized protein DUF1990 [Halopolyspora algeriensis]TQM56112.1 uncharacterized protein DUF1990 [Halopolyspora algeriensis]
MALEIRPVHHVVVVVSWLLGMALISWRYLWQTTPLHRVEEQGDATDLPPSLPEELVDEHCQSAEQGVGALFHRRFNVRIEEGELDARELMAVLKNDLNQAAPSEAAVVDRTKGSEGRFRVGDEFVVRMPGPWNAPVRVVGCEETSFRLATLKGHIEAGMIEFRARDEHDAVRFEIEAWARPSTRVLHLLYARMRLAKEMQLNMWTRFCLHAATLARGRARGGVGIHTRRVVLPAATESAHRPGNRTRVRP